MRDRAWRMSLLALQMTKEARVKLLEQELNAAKQHGSSGATVGAPDSVPGSSVAQNDPALVMPPPRPSMTAVRQIQGRTPSDQTPPMQSSRPAPTLARASSLKKSASMHSAVQQPDDGRGLNAQSRGDPARQVNVVADVVFTNNGKDATLLSPTEYSGLHSQRSFRSDSVRSSPRAAEEENMQPAVLEGFQADALQPQLRYGDSIALLPDGVNAAVAYAGDDDGRAWVEMLHREIGVPPNMRDCQWKLQPPRHYVEAKKLEKLMKTSDWDGGKKLPIPEVPYHGQNLEDYAGELSKLCLVAVFLQTFTSFLHVLTNASDRRARQTP
jgi:hypothetical protein